MDLVDEEQGSLPLFTADLGAVEGLSQVLHAGKNRRQLLEFERRLVGEEPRQGGLAAAGRSPQHDALDATGREHAAQCSLRTDEVVLADDLGEPRWAQPIGERAWRGFLEAGGLEEVGHGAII